MRTASTAPKRSSSGIPIFAAWFFCLFGFFKLEPNETGVLLLFGRYVGTVRKNGFYWANPFYSKRKITLSTAGVVPAMRRCGAELGVNLAVSLHAVTNEVRDRM